MFQEVGLRFRLEFDMGNLEWVIWLVVGYMVGSGWWVLCECVIK